MFGGELLELAQSHVAFDGWWMLGSLSHSGEALLGEVPLSSYSLLFWPLEIQYFPTNPSHLHPPKPYSHLQCLWYEINPQMFSQAAGGFFPLAAFPQNGG